jgi:hypothetical protein
MINVVYLLLVVVEGFSTPANPTAVDKNAMFLVKDLDQCLYDLINIEVPV